MENILIINFKRFGDIYTTGHLIQSLVHANPFARIYMLVYDEFQEAAKNLNNISRVFTIDRKRILTLKKNPLFLDSFCINAFEEELRPVANLKWSKIINYSNDFVSTNITSLLSMKNPSATYRGIKMQRGSVQPSSDWAIIFNDVLTTYKHTPIHFIDNYHYMSDVSYYKKDERLKINPKHNETAFKNINKIRKTESENIGENVKIVGIQLLTSSTKKDIPLDTIIDTIDEILDDPQFYPILLIAPNDHERKFAGKINQHFDNALITVESDFQALSSVLLNLDLLLTPDTVTKHVADLLEIPTIEVCIGGAPFLKQDTYNEGNIILVETEKPSDDEDDSSIKSRDILNAIRSFYNPDLEHIINLSKGVSLFRVQKDCLGTFYALRAGEYTPRKELSRLASRLYLLHSNNFFDDQHLFEEINTLPRESIQKWLQKEKKYMTQLSKDLLGTIRSLIMVSENRDRAVNFVNSLDKLLEYTEGQRLSSLPATIFKSKLDSLTNNDLGVNIKLIENQLYTLKTNLQVVFSVLKKIEVKCLTRDKITSNKRISRAEGL